MKNTVAPVVRTVGQSVGAVGISGFKLIGQDLPLWEVVFELLLNDRRKPTLQDLAGCRSSEVRK